MTVFATEFPIAGNPNISAFVAQVVSWLRGTKYSTVLNGAGAADLDGDAPVVRAPNGEELRLRVLTRAGTNQAIGFRHDFPDEEGRLWRTETVLRRAAAADGQDVLRLRTQCIAREAGVRLDAPRKPFLLKSVLQAGWGGQDGLLAVSDQPIWLEGSTEGLGIAAAVTTGTGSLFLPTIYVSALGPNRWPISKDAIEKLAYDLGGVAHVVVEPDRAFSFNLRDTTSGQNAYGGAVGISIPGRGIVRRFFSGGRLAEGHDFLTALRGIVLDIRSQMPANGWDWTELQEQALRQQRERDRNRLSAAETEALYDEEIEALKDQVDQLKDQLSRYNMTAVPESDEGSLASLSAEIGFEIYPGETLDRLRLAAKTTCATADRDGLDERSKALLEKFAKQAPSPGFTRLRDELKRVTKDGSRLADQLSHLLGDHGYREKSRNKHVRLEPQDGFEGLAAITVPTTPSDKRGLTNMRTQVERTLGLTKLGD